MEKKGAHRGWSCTPFLLLMAGAPLYASPAQQKIDVTLFGKRCSMSGPFDLTTLKSIHLISPEQIPPIESTDEADSFIKKVAATTQIPMELITYRKMLLEHLKAISAFYKAASETVGQKNKTTRVENFISALKTHMNGSVPKKFKEMSEKVLTRENNQEMELDPLLELYMTYIPTNPEAEFHRVIRTLEIHYYCSVE